jgi:hypothetical protein
MGRRYMKKIWFLAVCVSALAVISDCGRQSGKTTVHPWDPNVHWDGNAPAQDAIPDFFKGQPAGGEFPESMVGIWEVVVNDRNDKWGIKFEQDGSIKKIIHLLANRINIEEGGVEGKGQDGGSYYLFHIGACGARYIPETRMVRVKIIVDYYIMKMPAGELEGRIEDYFEGPVSKDGKIWDVKWWDFGWIKDAAPPDVNFVKAHPAPLVFIKQDPNQADVNQPDVNQPAAGKAEQ